MHSHSHATTPGAAPITHVFFDAEGTLWVPRPGRDFADFWADPRPERAEEVFMPAPGVAQVLDALHTRGMRLVVVSRHVEPILHALLARFGLAFRFDDVLVNGHKGARIVDWLAARGIHKHHALMVGDRHDLDIAPLEQYDIRAVLLDRPYNQGPPAERIRDLRALLTLDGLAPRRLKVA